MQFQAPLLAILSCVLPGARSFEKSLGREPVVEKPYASSPESASFACTHDSAPVADATTNPQQTARSEVKASFDASASSGPKAAPGSRASTFSPAELWTEFFSCLGSAKTSFSSFWHSIRSLPRPERGPLGRVWPMPVPFPSLHRPKAGGCSTQARLECPGACLVLAQPELPRHGPSLLGFRSKLKPKPMGGYQTAIG